MNWRVYTVRVVLVLFAFVLLGFFNLVNKFEFLKSACFVVAGFGLFFFSPPCCLPKVDLYISDT